LSFGSSNERAVSITWPQNNWNQNQNVSFWEFLRDSVKMSFLTVPRGVEENQREENQRVEENQKKTKDLDS
jgi:hypothetical protein